MSKSGIAISDALRQAIIDSGLNTMQIEAATGISNSQISRFLRGERSLTLPVADVLAEHLGLQLVSKSKEPKRRTQS